MAKKFLKTFLLFLFIGFIFSAEGAFAKEENYVPGEIIFKIKEEVSPTIGITTSKKEARTHSLEYLAKSYGVKEIENLFKNSQKGEISLQNQKEDPFSNIYKARFPENVDLKKVVKDYENHPSIEYAHLNYHLELYEGFEPNDPFFESGSQWGLEKIEAPKAWNIETGSDDIIIAIVDSGIDYNHEDLESNMWNGEKCVNENGEFLGGCTYGYDFGEDDKDPMDKDGHGTHVAGIAGAVGNNEKGVAGVSWSSKLMAVKIFDDEGSGDTVMAAKGIRYAAENGAHIINNSWGVSGYCEKLPAVVQSAINHANSERSLVIFAAGNDDKNCDPGKDGSQEFIDSYENVISVGATDEDDKKASFPNGGSNYGEWVDVFAPGKSILSTYPENKNKYASINGTSMAAPFVSGLAALILSKDSELERGEVWDIIIDFADDIDEENEGYKGLLGSGRINAYNSLTFSVVNFIEENNLENVSISIYDDDQRVTPIQNSLFTNQDGEAFTYLEDDDYWFTASKENYYDFEGDFTVSGTKLNISFSLKKEALLSFDDFSESFPDKQAGYYYRDISLIVNETNNTDATNTIISFKIKEQGEENYIIDKQEDIGTVTGGESSMVTFSLGEVVTAANYDVFATASADNMIDDSVATETFSVFSGTAGFFDLSKEDASLGYVPKFNFENGEDNYGNLLEGEYDVDFSVTNAKEGLLFDIVETVTFSEGNLFYYKPDTQTPVEENVTHTARALIDGVERLISFVPQETKVESVSINEDDKELMEGDEVQLTFTLEPARAFNKDVFWESENADVVTVSQEGLIKALKSEGSSEISVISACDNEKKDSITITATVKLYTVTFKEQDLLENVSIDVYRDEEENGGQVGDTIETDFDGEALINLEEGSYRFTATRANYEDYEGSFSVSGDRTVSFKMEPTPPPSSGGSGGGGGGSSNDNDDDDENDDDDDEKEEEKPKTSLSDLIKQRERLGGIKKAIENLQRAVSGQSGEIRDAVFSVLETAQNIEKRIEKEIEEREEKLDKLNNQKKRVSRVSDSLSNLISLTQRAGLEEGIRGSLLEIKEKAQNIQERIERQIKNI